MTARRRLTVSLVLAGDVAREIDGMRRGLGAGALERIAPHVTLVPPLNVRDDDLDQAVEVVRLAAQRCGPLRLELGPPQTFWPVAPVVYLAVGGDLEALDALREALRAGPLATPSSRDSRRQRRFVPHVTLDQNIEPSRIDSALQALCSYRATVTVERVTVLELREAARSWQPLATSHLGRPKVVGRGGLEVELSVTAMLDPAGEHFRQAEWEHYSKDAYGEGFGPDEPFAVTARVADEIAGTATGELRGELCHLAYLVVAAHQRSQGIGTHLLKATEQLAREHGADTVRLETRIGGPAAKFYRERGYEAVAVLPAWRAGHDFALMEHRLVRRRAPGEPRDR
ncbi:MAG: GNAT family N-acetyltransferase [Acidimicrobiales bacterium]